MGLQIQDNSVFRTSNAIVIKHIGKNNFAVWNRYLPSVVFLNEDGIKFLKYMYTNKEPYNSFKGYKRILRKMILNNLLFLGIDDPYKKDFLKGHESTLKRIHDSMNKQYNERLTYANFSIVNIMCNLKCPYCICNYIKNKNHKPLKKSSKDKINRLLNCIDQFLHTPQNEKEKVARRINFNGGEILLEWPIIYAVVNHIKKEYPDESVVYNINTNTTLITEEIANFLAINKFKPIAISIDGYKEIHNKTRKYHDGSGSFDDVMKGRDILNKYLPHPIDFYQGTIIDEHKLKLEKLMEMKKHGFNRARLGFNLIGINPKKAKKMANLHFEMIKRSKETGWKVDDNYFGNYASVLDKKGKGYNFHCMGLSFHAGKSLVYNIDTEMVNTLCSFTTDVQVSLDEINDDIYHPLIFEKGFNFLKRRYKIFKEACLNCEIVGICRGGCVLTGIDSFNRKNEAACVFQKETWKHFLTYTYSQIV